MKFYKIFKQVIEIQEKENRKMKKKNRDKTIYKNQNGLLKF